MNTNIIDYQKKDIELMKLTKSLEDQASQNILKENKEIYVNSQSRFITLEAEAEKLMKLYSEAEELFKKLVNQSNEVLNKNISNVTEEMVNSLQDTIETISKQLLDLQKRLNVTLESSKQISSDFEQTFNRFKNAKLTYQDTKQKLEANRQKVQPQLDEIEKTLKSLEKEVDPKLLEIYNHKKADRIMPVFVFNIENSCGGCRTEIASSMVDKLKANGMIECEHCRRIILNR